MEQTKLGCCPESVGIILLFVLNPKEYLTRDMSRFGLHDSSKTPLDHLQYVREDPLEHRSRSVLNPFGAFLASDSLMWIFIRRFSFPVDSHQTSNYLKRVLFPTSFVDSAKGIQPSILDKLGSGY